jgi:ubiquinone/menaquinone biosynthesis C-methylase UbiE
MMALLAPLARRFARLATTVVVRAPWLWRLFRGPLRRQFAWLAPRWDMIRTVNHLAPFEAALGAITTAPRAALDLGTGTGDGALAIARRFPEAEVVGVDLAEEMVEQARRKLPPEFAGRVRFEQADAARLPYPDGVFELVGLANMIPFFDELARVVAPGGAAVFGFSDGARTPIYVPAERLQAELARRGFSDFAEFSAGSGTALLARKAARP